MWYQKALAHRQYSRDAITRIGILYGEGLGVDKDHILALKYFNKAAQLGDKEAMFCLGIAYENGYGVERNWESALKWYHMAAIMGHKEAQCSTAVYMYNGMGTISGERLYDQSFYWMNRAANAGNPTAQYFLGKYYTDGTGCSINYTEAVKWFCKAAAQGHKYAKQELYGLGFTFEDGELWLN